MKIKPDKYIDEFLFHCLRCGTIFEASKEDNYDFEEKFNFSCGRPMGSCNCPECGERVYSTYHSMYSKSKPSVRFIPGLDDELEI